MVVRKGALGDNVPHCDLRVTKGHSLHLDGVLIPVEFLVNHRSIAWDDRAKEVTIFHVELDTHDILLANGAAAESYRDDGNRWLFQNGNSGWDQPAKDPCAPVLTGGPVVDAIWRRLLDRAGPRPAIGLTQEPDLHLRVDGVRVDGVRHVDNWYVFPIVARADEIRIVSLAAAPSVLGLARDPRVLGVGIRQLRVTQGARLRVLAASDDTLRDGFHGYEADNDFRWTDGDALVPDTLLAGVAGGFRLEVRVGGRTHYALLSEAA